MSAKLPMQPEEFRKAFEALQTELSNVIVGQQEVIESLLVAFFAGGHVLLEGVPGLGKTLLAKSFAKTLGVSFHRVQCTPDLMPADIIGTELVVDRDGRKVFEFAQGPVFTHILLADEINRATPKTQSALLEAMAEYQVTVSGKTYQLEEPFFVMATQNPIEMEGVYSLPEAQLDRFLFRIFITYPSSEELGRILRQTTVADLPNVRQVLPDTQAKDWILNARRLVREVLVAQPIEDYVVRLVDATRPDLPAPRQGNPHEARQAGGASNSVAQRFIRYGASPRGAQAILMGAKVLALVRGRVNVSFEDVDLIAIAALNHRIVLSFEAEAERRTAVDILHELTEPVRTTR
jgi:MoxR-like ATPase